MTQKDVLLAVLDLRMREERLEASAGRAGTLLPYEAPVFPVVEQTPPPEKMKSKHETEPLLDETRLYDMSTTELVQVCQHLGFAHAARHVDRDTLIGLVLGEVQGDIADPLDTVRRKTFVFVEGNKRLMVSKMRCSLHCPTCPHHKVVECYSANHDIVDAQPDPET